jgi:hypothetical protein
MYTMRYNSREKGFVIKRGDGHRSQIHSVHENEEDAREELRVCNVQEDMEAIAYRRIERLMSDLQKKNADHGLGPIGDDRIVQVIKVTSDVIYSRYAHDDPYLRKLYEAVGQFDSREVK